MMSTRIEASGAGIALLRRYAGPLCLAAITMAIAVGLFVLRLSALQMLLGAVAIALTMTFVLRPIWGFYAFVSTFAAEYLLGLSEFFTITKLLGALVLGAWLLDVVVSRRYRIPRAGVLIFGPALILCAVISLLVAEDIPAGLERIATIVQLNLLMMLAATTLRTERNIENLGWIIVFTALVPVVFILKEVGPRGSIDEQAFLYNRNAMALFLSITVPFLFYLFRRAAAPAKVMIAGLAGLFAVSVSLSLSRGGFVAFNVALLLSWLLVVRGQRTRVLIVFGVLIACVSLVLPEAVWERMGSIVPALLEGRDTMGMRYELWRINVAMIEDHFWLGVGPGNYFHHYMRYSGVMGLMRAPLPAHNTYLEVMVEMGAVGLVAFVLLQLAAFRALWFARKRALREGRLDVADLCGCIAICLAVFVVGGLKGGVQYYKYLWCFFGATASLTALAYAARAGGAPADRTPTADPS